MNLNGDDLEAAYYVTHRFVNGLRAQKKPVPKSVADYCFNVTVAWETSADGHAPQPDSGESDSEELVDAATAARIVGVTERQIRRLANDLDGRKCSGVWVFAKQTVVEYGEARSGRTGPGSGAEAR